VQPSYLPLDPDYSPERLAFMLADAERLELGRELDLLVPQSIALPITNTVQTAITATGKKEDRPIQSWCLISRT
jgi:hypothetical protein